MKNPVKANIKIKDYSPGQTMLLPPSLDEMIDTNHRISGLGRGPGFLRKAFIFVRPGRSRVAVMRSARPEGKT